MSADTEKLLPIMSRKIEVSSPKGVSLTLIHGLKESCLAFSIPRGKGFKTVVGYYLTDAGHDQLLTALLDWHHVEDELPDDDVRVLIALDLDTSEPEFGYHNAGAWYLDGPPHLTPAEVAVYAWAHCPGLPAKKGEVAA